MVLSLPLTLSPSLAKANLREHHDDDGDHEEDMGNNFDLDDVQTVTANKTNATTAIADARKTFHAQSISL